MESERWNQLRITVVWICCLRGSFNLICVPLFVPLAPFLVNELQRWEA